MNSIGKITDELVKLYRNGKPAGYELGFNEVEGKITIMPGIFSLWYGYPESGKTRLVLCFCVYLAKKYGLKFYINTLEDGEKPDVYRLLLCIWVGKPFFEDNPEMSRLSEQEIHRYMPEIHHHFHVEDKIFDSFEDVTKDVEKVQEVVGEFFGVVVDPLVYVVPMSGAIAQNYADGLKVVKAYAKLKKQHWFLCTHGTDPKSNSKSNLDELPPIRPMELAGGQNLWRMGYLMVSVYRRMRGRPDDRSERGTAFTGNEVDLIVQKAKPEGSAEKGVYRLCYNSNRFNYYEVLPNGSKRFNHDIGEGRQFVPKQLPVNLDFDSPKNGLPLADDEEEIPF